MTPIDSLRAEVRQLRAELQAMRANAVAVGWTNTAKSSAMGAADEVQTADDDKNRGQRPVSRLEPFGLRYRAPAKLRSLTLRIGTSNVIFVGIQPSKGYGPTDLEDGEVCLYCSAAGATVKLDKDGNIILTPAAGKKVQVAGSSYALPKWDDFMTQFAAFLRTLKTVTNATASVVATAATTMDTARTVAGDWKSQSAQNG